MHQNLGQTIRKYRTQRNYTLAQLAKKLNISVGLLSNIETGKTDSFQLTLLNNIIRELEIPLSELKLFSKPYPIKKLKPDIPNNIDILKPSLETLIDTFISIYKEQSLTEIEVALITDMLVKELKTFNKLIKSAKSK